LNLSKHKVCIFGLVGTANNFEILIIIFVINENGQRGKQNSKNNEIFHHGTDHEECRLPGYKLTRQKFTDITEAPPAFISRTP
jgi:hypothetical protein